MSLWDKARQLFGQTAPARHLQPITEQDHLNAIIKERADLCDDLNAAATPQTVRRDGVRDITFQGWQVCNVEERHAQDNRRLAYLKLFQTRNDKFVCQRMTLIDDEEKRYTAATVEDLDGLRGFFGEDSLALALYIMLDRQYAPPKQERA